MLKQLNYRKLILAFTAFIVLTVFSAGTFSNQVAAAPYDLTGSTVVADIAEQSSPAVVWIISTYETQDPTQRFFFDQPRNSQGLGSGFFFNENGSILTNAHVVAGAKTIEVTLKDQKNPVTATLVGIDQELDLAVLKVNLPNKVPYLKFGDSEKARIGEWVIAIGNPLGLDHTVTLGIISAKGRPLMASQGSGNSQSYEDMIQTDAAINPGNSGGPLLNLHGDVIGINTAVSAAGQGLGFAIPINSVKSILNELITKGKISRPWLGVYLMDLKVVSARAKLQLGLARYSEGVLIDPVPNSPASQANLQQYDLITEFNHQKVADSNELINLIKKQKVGAKVNLTIIRDGKEYNVDLVLQEKP